MKGRGSGARDRRALIKKASYYSVAFFAAGVLVAIVGAALVAVLLRIAGLPFLPTWLGLSVLVIGVSLVAVLLQARKKP